MSRPITRYRPSRRYAVFALIALLAAALCVGASARWGSGWIVASVLFGLTAVFTTLLALRPAIEVHHGFVQIGVRKIFWTEIQGVDRVAVGNAEPWAAPLLLRLVLASGEEFMLLHPGDADSCVSLLRHFYRSSRLALLDGVPYAEFWGETTVEAPAPLSELPRPRLLLAEDEDEVERMFQRLQSGGRLDDSEAGAGQGLEHGSDES